MNKTIIMVIVVVLVGAGSFFAGTKVKSKSVTSNFPQMGGQMRNGQGVTQRIQSMGGGMVGEIIAKDDTSITIKLADGGSKIVIILSSTNVNKTTGGSKDDLKIGEQVMVVGRANSDGSINAQSVQLGSGIQTFGRPPQQ